MVSLLNYLPINISAFIQSLGELRGLLCSSIVLSPAASGIQDQGDNLTIHLRALSQSQGLAQYCPLVAILKRASKSYRSMDCDFWSVE